MLVIYLAIIIDFSFYIFELIFSFVLYKIADFPYSIHTLDIQSLTVLVKAQIGIRFISSLVPTKNRPVLSHLDLRLSEQIYVHARAT